MLYRDLNKEEEKIECDLCGGHGSYIADYGDSLISKPCFKCGMNR